MLCLEIPGCVQHKLMYGAAQRRDRSHYSVGFSGLVRGIAYPLAHCRFRRSSRPMGKVPTRADYALPTEAYPQGRIITLHHSSIKANEYIVLDTSNTSW